MILRLASVYGPGEIIDRAIPNFINSVINNKSPIIYGDGSDKRDYLYIEDAAEAILCALKCFRYGTYNIASGRPYTIKQIADIIIKISGKNLKPIFKKRKKQKNDFVFDISNSRKLGFVPKTHIIYGLKKEMVWHIIGDAKKIYIDVDGTIIDVLERLYRLHKGSIESLGIKPLKKEVYIKLKRSGKSEKSIIEEKYKIDVFGYYNKIRMNNIEKERYLNLDELVPNSIDALKKLKMNHKVFLVTNRKSKRLFFKQIEKFELTRLVDGFLFSRKNLSGKEGVIIGDSEDDILTAKKLKWKVIAVESGLRDKDFLLNLKPDLIIKDASEILY